MPDFQTKEESLCGPLPMPDISGHVLTLDSQHELNVRLFRRLIGLVHENQHDQSIRAASRKLELLYQLASALNTISGGNMGPSRIAAMFDQNVEGNKTDKREINNIIMNYLVNQGYAGSAQKFAQELNLADPTGPDGMDQRVRVRDLIHMGKIDEAIELINEFDPAILDKQHILHFNLLQAQLIEIIRKILNKNSNPPVEAFKPVINFATKQLAPRAPTDPKYLKILEKTMALTIYPEDKMLPELKALLEVQLRADLAKDVNSALLESCGEQSGAFVQMLASGRVWAETAARDAGAPVPTTMSVGLEGEVEQNGGSNAAGDPMIIQ